MNLTAKPIPAQRKIGGKGLETLVDTVARVLLIFGLLFALVMFWLTGALGWPALLPIVSIAVSTLLTWLLLRCIAEGLRLLKRIAGIEYEGRISGCYVDTVSACSNCGAILQSDVCCNVCGARMVKADDEDTEA